MFDVFSFRGLLLYNCNNLGQFTFHKKVELVEFVIDFDFNTESGDLYILQNSNEKPVVVLNQEGVSVTDCNNECSLRNFFSDIPRGSGTSDNLDVLYKRWYNNVETYHENKEARIQGQKAKEPPIKKVKV